MALISCNAAHTVTFASVDWVTDIPELWRVLILARRAL
jgi:hypothetical protein